MLSLLWAWKGYKVATAEKTSIGRLDDQIDQYGEFDILL